ncbi:Kiwa anti-phage protein KwaB-like domain-containing protein [Azospirillum agricola]|uniref:Kiwa anti-phage protein KwaB-like domain-containing protein n=1 Tax=Azospirillum agricola TaxID=1720247 RepID=UPI000A0EF008|nr:Kiwa anti-phage protein KwaB-like domain-containing protein [Azospirillum agricola]SMH62819.1 protein of unknown function [Azospirillum lipoferum]
MPEELLTRPLDHLNSFSLENASVTLWTFKKSQKSGQTLPTFTGYWVEATDEVDNALKDAVRLERDRITETHEYGLLAQNNETSALTISSIETNSELILSQAADEIDSKKVKKVKNLQNTDFYAVKFVSGGKVLYSVKKTDYTWKTKKEKNAISIFFSDDQIGLSEDRSFSLSKYVDFFIIEGIVLITNKQNFESVLNYKKAHIEDFSSLQSEREFSSIFSDMSEIVTYVGANKMHLRRVSAIRQKGHYKNALFMDNLKNHHERFGLKINFDNDGKIIPCAETCKDIFVSLLDHRLISPFSNDHIYDVQNTDRVNV